MLLRILNIIIVFQHLFESFINAYKRYFLNESFFVDNRDKILIIIASKKRERSLKKKLNKHFIFITVVFLNQSIFF